MVSDEHYDLCLPVLQDATLEDEDKTDRLEDLLRDQTNLSGTSLDNAVLDALWRYRDGAGVSASPPPIRHSILRRASPASFRGSPTPMSSSPRLGVSPLAPPGFIPSTFGGRSIGAQTMPAASPFSSPRASPRPGYVTPAIMPHSPNLSAYEFSSDNTPATEIQGEYQTENVEWLVNDDTVSLSSSVGTSSGLNAAAPEFSSSMSSSSINNMSSQQADMSPYDMLRSILGGTGGQARTDDEIESALAAHGYDLSATIASLMDNESGGVSLHDDVSVSVTTPPDEPKSSSVLVGKSVSPDVRPSTPVNGNHKAGIICKFYMSTGQCLRADCRFSHDLSNHLCKYWMMGSCLAGDTCVFSHDPAKLLNKMSLEGSRTPPSRHLQLHDSNSFPSLNENGDHLSAYSGSPSLLSHGMLTPPGLRTMRHGTESPRSRSRPGSSRHHRGAIDIHASSASSTAPALDDTEAFPSLGSTSTSASKLQAKKHHGKRGGHGHRDISGASTPNSSMADIVKMSPSPGPAELSSKKPSAAGGGRSVSNGVTAIKNGSSGGSGENSAAAQAIPSPKNIPWLETGERANKAYLKSRQEAIKHGGLRNKFLQSAAQAWNRNDARAAKALSLRGQSENDLMRKAHREAARELYEERNSGNKNRAGSEMYVDLHGLHPEEAVEYLEKVLLENSKETRPIYAITGSGHHSKNGKDKVGKAIRNFLNQWRYAYREFSVPGDRNNMGGILGIDPRSWDRSLEKEGGAAIGSGSASGSVTDGPDDQPETKTAPVNILDQAVEIGDGKVRLLVRDPPKGPRR